MGRSTLQRTRDDEKFYFYNFAYKDEYERPKVLVEVPKLKDDFERPKVDFKFRNLKYGLPKPNKAATNLPKLNKDSATPHSNQVNNLI